MWVRLYGLGGQEGGAYSVGEAVSLGGQEGGAYSVGEAVRFGRSGGWRL